MTDKNVTVESNVGGRAGASIFEQRIKEQEEQAKRDAELAKRKKEAAKKREGGGVTKIGTKVGTASAFKTLFEAKAEGNDVKLKETGSGWNHDPNAAAGHTAGPTGTGKWSGGGKGGITAEVIKVDKPQREKISIADLVRKTDSGNEGKGTHNI